MCCLYLEEYAPILQHSSAGMLSKKCLKRAGKFRSGSLSFDEWHQKKLCPAEGMQASTFALPAHPLPQFGNVSCMVAAMPVIHLQHLAQRLPSIL
jgi:hypothetical protein